VVIAVTDVGSGFRYLCPRWRSIVQIPTEGSTRIVVADDHPAVRAGVCSLLSCNPTWYVCGEAGDGEEALEKVQKLKPDVVILDIKMPAMNGIAAARKIRQISPATKILIFSMDDSEEVEAQVRRAGADGFISKAKDPSCLIDAVRRLTEAKSPSCVY
jgi:DNA-binding NarL/FixJ family response regulator